MTENKNPKLNASARPDPTAYDAITHAAVEEKDVNKLVTLIKYVVDKAGYELIGRISVKSRKTGKEYR